MEDRFEYLVDNFSLKADCGTDLFEDFMMVDFNAFYINNKNAFNYRKGKNEDDIRRITNYKQRFTNLFKNKKITKIEAQEIMESFLKEVSGEIKDFTGLKDINLNLQGELRILNKTGE